MKDKQAFGINERGFTFKAWYCTDNDGDAIIEVWCNEILVREFLYPAYKIWNIAAHVSDIIDGELSKTDTERGYRIAGDMMLVGGCVMPRPIPGENR